MNLSQMEQQTASNVKPAYSAAIMLFQPYQGQPLPVQLWLALLEMLFEFVQPAAYKQARLARKFYDSERERALPGAPIHPIDLAGTTFEGFVRDMEEVRPLLAKGETSDGELHQVALRVARAVEGAGRRTIIRAVEEPDPAIDEYLDDPDNEDFGLDEEDHFLTDEEIDQKLPYNRRRKKQREPGKVRNLVRGWARVPTGAETCGFCWMLASRGPVYGYHTSVGLKVGFQEALQLHAAGELSHEHMNQWHTGCDCKVVPVFKVDDWQGMDRWLAAEKLWYDTTGPYTGKDKMRAYRRAVEAGKIQEYLAKHKKAA